MVALRETLLGDLRRRFPALRTRHEDLAQEALADLSTRVLAGGEGVPAAWLAPEEPASEEDRAHLVRLARTILRRRVADMFRARVRGRDGEPLEHEPEGVASTDVQTDRALHATKLLEATLAAMDELSPNDREALMLAAERDGERVEGRMPDKDRQRLSRARARLIERLRARLGDSVLAQLSPEE
jgi:DNA-directed RNA polymerase specialized sigma24 family protein